MTPLAGWAHEAPLDPAAPGSAIPAGSGAPRFAEALPPRIGGWLNASGVHDFNYLHSHGADVAWSLVYYVQSGQPAPSIQSGQPVFSHS